MDLSQLIAELSRPEAFPGGTAPLEVRQTHISVVFLGAVEVYKIKKPVNLGFLDFTALESRRHFCEEEVRLNRRLAPAVYQGIVPVTAGPAGLRFGGDGPAVDWAVHMRRLPDRAMMGERLRHGEIGPDQIRLLAERLAGFHATAASGSKISEFGRFAVVAANARENFEQTRGHVGSTISATVHERARLLTEKALSRLQSLIEKRADRDVPRDTHGDLHLDHIYWFPEKSPPEDLVMIDAIEFNERFRYADPVADVAFVAMDLCLHGRADLAGSLAQAYFRKSGDIEGAELLPFYLSYRAAVRAKVDGMKASEREVPADQRLQSIRSARAHWLLCLSTLEQPGRRPCMVLIGGLPGTGKSTLARGLAERAGFLTLRSDVVRKELASEWTKGLPHGMSDLDIYTDDWSERTYAECLRRASQIIDSGGRVIVDATFIDDAKRTDFLKRARELCVPAIFLECRVRPELVVQRLSARRGDASDATLEIHQKLARLWQPPSHLIEAAMKVVDTADRSVALENAVDILKSMELL